MVTAFLAGCWSAAGGGARCLPVLQPAALPESIRESSGVVASRRYEGVYWTLDDSGPSELYAVDAQGVLVGRVEVPTDLGEDREDLSLGPCESGECLYIADVGDNLERRRSVALYRLPEPDPTDDIASPPEVFRFRLPDGPRDVEAAYLLPGERLHLLSKGRNGPPTLYRYPGPLRDDATVVLEAVQRFGDGARPISRQVTGADASPDGRIVVVRTYETLALFHVAADTLAPIPGSTVDLRTLREPQGEGVAMAPGGRIVLTSERGPFGGRGSIALLGCEIDW
jgi:hypothetical protein